MSRYRFKMVRLLSFFMFILMITPSAQLAGQPVEQKQNIATVDFKVTQDWGTGFEYTLEIKNTSNQVITDWKLGFEYTGKINSVWNGSLSQSSNTYTISNVGWNKDIAPGQVISLGGGGERIGQMTNVTINGIAIDDSIIVPEPTPTPTPEPTPTPDPQPGVVGQKLLIGYWHNFDNGSSNIRLRDIPTEWDVVQVAFGETTTDRALIEFKPYNCTDEEFKQDIKYLNSRGVKVILSIGGQNGVVHIDSPADVDKFVNSISGLVDKYGFNGLDIDVENGITVTAADKDLKNPATPRLKYMIEAINKVCDKYGSDFWLTMAPEIAYVQGGIVAFGGPWGAYLPIIEGVRNNLTMIHVQHYNCGGNPGLDGRDYTAGTADFEVAMAEMLMHGFNIQNDPNAYFAPLRPDQVGIGIPAKPSAAPAGGYIEPAEMQKALDYLINGKEYGGNYKLKSPQGYKDFRGVMTWSINWDATQGNSFAKFYRQYFDAIGGQRLPAMP